MGRQADRESYDAVYRNAPEYRAHYKDSIYYPLWAQVVSFIRRIPSPRILEIGCGTGQFASFLREEGFRDYAGFDFSAEAVARAKEAVSMDFSVGDALDSANYRREYNVIVALEVLEHVERDLDILGHVRTGTHVIFSVPMFDEASHVRHFGSKRSVNRRYFRLVRFERLVQIDRWFVACGIVDPYRTDRMCWGACLAPASGYRLIRSWAGFRPGDTSRIPCREVRPCAA